MSLSILNKGIGLHGGLIYVSNITQIFHILIFILSILILQLTGFHYRRFLTSQLTNLNSFNAKFKYHYYKLFDKMEEQFKIIEYPLIILFVITGACLLISTNDLVSIFLSIELQSYGLYLLSTIYRNSELSTTGGLIYFLIGGLGSCFILLGTALLYANSGTSSLDALYIINNISDVNSVNSWYKPYYINFSLLIFSLGFLIKIGAAPFHFWSPDVYDAIPTVVTVFVAIIAKISIFMLLLQLVYYTNNSFFEINWTFSLIISSLLSLLIGTIVGLTQFRIKRLLAYSTISHVGFILLALAISSVESIQAFIFYIIQYSISNLNIFIILLAIGYTMVSNISWDLKSSNLSIERHNSPIQLVSELRGFFFINPFLAISLAITIFSFVGIPPLIGFFGKLMVLSAALDKGYIFIVLIAILTSVIGGVYYLNIVKETFFYYPTLVIDGKEKNFEKSSGQVEIKEGELFNIGQINNMPTLVLSGPIAFTISTITLVILLFIFINNEWLSMGTILVQMLFDN
jgi:NADH-ubiquinone oxidoreductase chain 2